MVNKLGFGIFKIPTTISGEINIIKELVSKINKKILVNDPIIITSDEDIDWQSDIGSRIFIGKKYIRTWTYSVIGKNLVFEVSIFED